MSNVEIYEAFVLRRFKRIFLRGSLHRRLYRRMRATVRIAHPRIQVRDVECTHGVHWMERKKRDVTNKTIILELSRFLSLTNFSTFVIFSFH